MGFRRFEHATIVLCSDRFRYCFRGVRGCGTARAITNILIFIWWLVFNSITALHLNSFER